MSDDISKKAIELVNGERQATYGHPYHNFVDIGRIWGSILDVPDIDPEKVALMMMGGKIARLKNKYHKDGEIDFFGYENCLDQIIEYKTKIQLGENYAKTINTTLPDQNTSYVSLKNGDCWTGKY